MASFRWARQAVGTVPFPQAKEYQTLKVGAYEQEDDSESEIDLYTTDDQDYEDEEEDEDVEECESEDEVRDELSEQESEQEESVSPEKNWWDNDS
jgi:hypothetical protein